MTNKLPTPRKPRDIDWQAVERDYRTGAFTTRELGRKYGCSHVAVGKHARQESWTQDLRGAVRAANSAKLISATAVRTEATKEATAVTNTVLAAAEVDKAVILGHRADISEARAVALGLLDRPHASRHIEAGSHQLHPPSVTTEADGGSDGGSQGK